MSQFAVEHTEQIFQMFCLQMDLHKLKMPFIKLFSSCNLYAHMPCNEKAHLISISSVIIARGKKYVTTCW